MSNPVWPATLPTHVLAAGYGEAFADQAIETPMDGGAVKSRRRFTRRFDAIDCALILDEDQVEALEAFYYETLGGGVLPFDWVHPRTQQPMTFKFRQPAPKVGDADGNFHVSFRLERQS